MSLDVTAAAERYARVGRVAKGFASGKMRGDPVYAAVLEYIRPGITLLDVGCGEGYLLALAHEHVVDLTLVGLDHDARRVEQGRIALSDVPDCTLSTDDVRTADLPVADVITCLDVLHYQTPEEQDAILGRLAAALAPGGVLLVRDGRSDGGVASWVTRLSETVAMALGRHQGDGVYFRPLDELTAAFERVGLSLEHDACADGTPFANLLFVARRPEDA